jgi:hypothetical protein
MNTHWLDLIAGGAALVALGLAVGVSAPLLSVALVFAGAGAFGCGMAKMTGEE